MIKWFATLDPELMVPCSCPRVITYSVRSVGGLRVHRRVPVVIVEDDDVGGREGHSESSGPRAQQEGEDLRVVLELADLRR